MSPTAVVVFLSLALSGRPVAKPPRKRARRIGPSAPLDSLWPLWIVRRVAEDKDAVAGVAFLDVSTGDSLFLNADDSFHAASTMKVPVMIELYRRVDAGTLRLDQPIPLANQFASIVDGSPYTLDPRATTRTARATCQVGKRVPVGELIDHMITRSSNLATNALIDLVGEPNA